MRDLKPIHLAFFYGVAFASFLWALREMYLPEPSPTPFVALILSLAGVILYKPGPEGMRPQSGGSTPTAL